MSRRFVSRLPWALLALYVLMTVSGFWLEGLNGPEPGEQAASNPVIIVIALIVLAATGALVASRQTANPVGWLFMGLPLWLMLAGLASQYARYSLITRQGFLPGGVAAAWLGSLVWVAGPASLVYALMLFPDGRLPSHRWRTAAWGAGIALFIAVVAIALVPGPLVDSDFVDNPLGIEALGGLDQSLKVAATALLPILLLISVASLIVKYRRSEAQDRIRIKWFAYAAFLFASTMPVGMALDASLPNWVGELIFAVNIILLSAGVGIGILRHRLFDIDLIIRRTVVYVVLVGLITGAYFMLVYTAGSLIWWGTDPGLGIAATAFIAIAFQPVRRWVQRLANRLVYGQRATPYEAMADFSHQMAGALSIEAVLPRMAETAAKGIGATQSRVRVFLPDGAERSASWPDHVIDGDFDRVVEVAHQGEPVGEISVVKTTGDPITAAEEKLLDDLASQAGPVLSNVRLVEELRESRSRIVKTQDEERRRMLADIHDGAQQQLVSISVKLGLVNNLLSRDIQRAGAMLKELRGEASEAVETLRDLVRGWLPEVLTDLGLKSALESHIEKMDLDATVFGEIARFDKDIEANVYFCIREALQNASKHAPGASIVVSLNYDVDELSFSVKDEGPGFDPTTVKMGSGLQNMKDRVEALGGSMQMDSGSAGGAELRARIPARSMEAAAP